MGRIWSREPAISLADDHHPEPQARAVALEFVIIAVFIYSMDNCGVIVYTRGFVDKNPDATARFVKASLEGWKPDLFAL